MPSLLRRWFGGEDAARAALRPLYDALVAKGRQRWWYAEGAVPDTLDGRFDMIAAILAVVLIRLEADGESGRASSALLAEVFIDDMDGQLRQRGIGDIVVGKHIGRMMAALGGRLDAYRASLGTRDLGAALERNLWRGAAPAADRVAIVAERLDGWWRAIGTTSTEQVLAGELPA